ncbi:MAG TPA: sulfite exporter TauE/SafE family protein, partial [Actinomycetales bacterium]|nr:sulfite exporter TauE/SafE family protein [Actinomycetales bacterium]
MSPLEIVVVLAAGFAAGAINVVVGAGTLVSFPAMVALGFPPLTATMSNSLGIVPGSASGAYSYRREIRKLWPTARVMLPASIAGGILGATLLLTFGAEVFSNVVPWLIALGTVLVLVNPWIKRRLAARNPEATSATTPALEVQDSPAYRTRGAMVGAMVAVFLIGTYGGYFSAAQGVLFLGAVGILSTLHMQDVNALKNLTVMGVNLVAATVYLITAPELIHWGLVGLLAV